MTSILKVSQIIQSHLLTDANKQIYKKKHKQIRTITKLIYINFHFMDFFVFAFSLLIIIIERIVPSLKFLNKPSFWPTLYLQKRIKMTYIHLSMLTLNDLCALYCKEYRVYFHGKTSFASNHYFAINLLNF